MDGWMLYRYRRRLAIKYVCMDVVGGWVRWWDQIRQVLSASEDQMGEAGGDWFGGLLCVVC